MKSKRADVIDLVCQIELLCALRTTYAIAPETYQEKREEAVNQLLEKL